MSVLADPNEARVRANKRLALILGAVAVAFYVLFLILEA